MPNRTCYDTTSPLRPEVEHKRILRKYLKFCADHQLVPYTIASMAIKLGSSPAQMEATLEAFMDRAPGHLIELHYKREVVNATTLKLMHEHVERYL